MKAGIWFYHFMQEGYFFTIINMNLDLSKIINWNWVEVVLGII